MMRSIGVALGLMALLLLVPGCSLLAGKLQSRGGKKASGNPYAWNRPYMASQNTTNAEQTLMGNEPSTAREGALNDSLDKLPTF
ncbi:hypothetical protein ACFL59_04550 [Planctomycetota bacterium]